jgi:hypothetical protein
MSETESGNDRVHNSLKHFCVELVVRQTDYNQEEAKKELEKYDYNYLKLLKEYMGVKDKTETVCVTSNQERYRLIRKTMDDSEETYLKKKELGQTP